eukprot:TRINITY_DN30434_c0_g1_i1.p1 TRINITY_DN30434_c0_g1~~TRINITY_DN30434_c0_g1_i1.p1  ORF type:complete len:411 (-),score=72.60 TRINITY_DN30434_c0_g1_i1:277-1509(-)
MTPVLGMVSAEEFAGLGERRRRRAAGRSTAITLLALLSFGTGLSASTLRAFSVTALGSGAALGPASSRLGPRRIWKRHTCRSCVRAQPEEEGQGGLAPVPAAFNLMKNVMGSGILSLSAGVAAFSANPRALLPATLLLAVPLGLLAAYTYYLVAQQCDASGTKSYGEAWSKIINERSGALISSLVTLECFSGCVAYTMILGDAFSLMLAPHLPIAVASRTSCILGITLFILFPLSRLRDLAPLAKFSLLGTFGIIYTAGFMGLRLFQGAYSGPGASFVGAVPGMPLEASAPWMPNVSSLMLASIFSTAYMAHFNAPRMLQELRTPPAPPGSPDSPQDRKQRKLRSFAKVVFAGYAAVISLSAFVMAAGFLTFGPAAQGNILDSYSVADPLAGLARVAIAASVLFGHPLQL